MSVCMVCVWYVCVCVMSVCMVCVVCLCVMSVCMVCVWYVCVCDVCVYGVCVVCLCVCVLCVWYMVRGVCFSSVGRGFGWRPALASFLEGSFPRCCLVGGHGAASGDVRVASDERDWGQCVGQQLLLSRSCAFFNPQDREIYECFPHLLVQEDLSFHWSGKKEDEALG